MAADGARSLDDHVRLYLPSGRIAHIKLDADTLTLCGKETFWVPWRGTGCQSEYDQANALPTCQLCERQLRDLAVYESEVSGGC